MLFRSGTGLWTITSGAGGTVVTPTSPTSPFTGVAGTTYTLNWTISNGVCVASVDGVSIQLDASPTVSAAGADQNICGASAVLAANVPGTGSGLWSIVSGAGGSFVLATNPGTTFNGVAGTTYILRWTITSGV